MQNARERHESNINRRSVLTAGAWSVPVIALAAATPAAAASTTAPWTPSDWFALQRTGDTPDRKLLVISFRVNEPQTVVQQFGFAITLALASAPTDTVDWWSGNPTVAPGDNGDQCIVRATSDWPSEFSIPGTSGSEALNITVSANNGSESHLLTGSAFITLE